MHCRQSLPIEQGDIHPSAWRDVSLGCETCDLRHVLVDLGRIQDAEAIWLESRGVVSGIVEGTADVTFDPRLCWNIRWGGEEGGRVCMHVLAYALIQAYM